jgi:hypothetical protein
MLWRYQIHIENIEIIIKSDDKFKIIQANQKNGKVVFPSFQSICSWVPATQILVLT